LVCASRTVRCSYIEPINSLRGAMSFLRS